MTGVIFLAKNKFFSSLLTNSILIISLFFVLKSEMNILLGGAIVIFSLAASDFLAEKLFHRFSEKKVSPPTVIGSFFLLFLIAFYFIELYS